MVEVAGVARSAAEFIAQSGAPGLRLRRALWARTKIALLRDQAEADLLGKLRSGSPFPFGGGRWRCFPTQGDFNETSDSELWRDATQGRPLWKGESFDQFDPHGAGQRVCPVSREAVEKARKPRPGAKSLSPARSHLGVPRGAEPTLPGARLAFKDVTQRNNSRTVHACLIPPEHFLTNSAPYLTFVDPDPKAEAACLALMNSLVFDWQARRFVEIHVNFFILEGLRLPDLDDDAFATIATAAARLSCPDQRFADFAAATGVEVGLLRDEERTSLRAEIDARLARAWALTPEELELVFEDFTEGAVPLAYRQMVRQRLAA